MTLNSLTTSTVGYPSDSWAFCYRLLPPTKVTAVLFLASSLSFFYVFCYHDSWRIAAISLIKFCTNMSSTWPPLEA